MKKLLIPIVLLALASGCATKRDPTAQPGGVPTMLTQTVTDRNGNVVETVTDNRGKNAAAEGQALLTTEQMWEKLVQRVPTTESPTFGWTMTDTSYSVLDIPNEEKIKELEVNHKKILEEAAKFAASGATKQYDDAIRAAASVAGEIASLIKNRSSGDSGQRGDRASIVSRTISVGPDHTKVPLAQAQAMQAAVTSRHGNQNTIKVVETNTDTDTSTTEEIKAALESRNMIAAQAARIEELRILAEQTKRAGKPLEETVTDTPDSNDTPAADKPAGTTAYDQLKKKNYLYKTRLAANNPVTRHDSAFLIPKDRPKPVKLYIPGQTVAENYFSTSEDRWLLRLKGALPNTPASAVVTYEDGNSETFAIASLAGRTDKPAGAYKAAVKPSKPEVPAGQGESLAP